MDHVRRKRIIKRTIKEQGILFFVPLIISDVMIPCIVWTTYKKFGAADETRRAILSFTQYFMPFFAGWWIFLNMMKYIDGEGNEIFYIRQRSKITEVLMLYGFYIAANTWPYLIYRNILQNSGLEWLRICIESFLFVSMVYFFAFLLKSMAFAMIPTVCYGFASAFDRGMHRPVFYYYDEHAVTTTMLQQKYGVLLLIACLLLFVGYVLNTGARFPA